MSFDLKHDCLAWQNIPNMHWDSWWNMFFDTDSKNLVATGRASNHSNPCGTNFYPGCARANFSPDNPPPLPTDGATVAAEVAEAAVGEGGTATCGMEARL